MFRLALTRFIATSRVAISSPTCLSYAQHRFFHKLPSQSNENPILSTIRIGNIIKGNKSNQIGIYFLCKIHKYNIKHLFINHIKKISSFNCR